MHKQFLRSFHLGIVYVRRCTRRHLGKTIRLLLGLRMGLLEKLPQLWQLPLFLTVLLLVAF